MKAKIKKTVRRVVIPLKYVNAVNLGVKWLDLTLGRKEWLRRIDMSQFDIRVSNVCVMGNVFKDSFFNNDSGRYTNDDGYERFEELMVAIGADKDGTKFGFYSDTDKGMQYLQDLWVMKIKKLKAAAKRNK